MSAAPATTPDNGAARRDTGDDEGGRGAEQPAPMADALCSGTGDHPVDIDALALTVMQGGT